MVSSIEELRITAGNLRKEGLNSQQIADELSLSQDTISWLLAGSQQNEERPTDVRIGWRTIGVKPNRIAAIGTIMADVADEERIPAIPECCVATGLEWKQTNPTPFQ